jgi:lysophospholipase L1-like esterase
MEAFRQSVSKRNLRVFGHRFSKYRKILAVCQGDLPIFAIKLLFTIFKTDLIRVHRRPKMKTFIISAIISALLLISCSDGTAGGEEENKTIACFGNSLTEGYGGDGKSYPHFLAQKVNIPVVNLGKTGISAEEAAGIVKNYRKEFSSAAIVIIELGANDLLNRAFASFILGRDIDPGFVEESVEKSLETILGYIEGLSGERKIYLAKFYNEAVKNDLIAEYGDIGLSLSYEEYEKLFARLENKYDVEIIDNIWDGVWGKDNLMFDEIHPNANGYAIMAENYFISMKNFLQSNGFAN